MWSYSSFSDNIHICVDQLEHGGWCGKYHVGYLLFTRTLYPTHNPIYLYLETNIVQILVHVGGPIPMNLIGCHSPPHSQLLFYINFFFITVWPLLYRVPLDAWGHRSTTAEKRGIFVCFRFFPNSCLILNQTHGHLVGRLACQPIGHCVSLIIQCCRDILSG